MVFLKRFNQHHMVVKNTYKVPSLIVYEFHWIVVGLVGCARSEEKRKKRKKRKKEVMNVNMILRMEEALWECGCVVMEVFKKNVLPEEKKSC